MGLVTPTPHAGAQLLTRGVGCSLILQMLRSILPLKGWYLFNSTGAKFGGSPCKLILNHPTDFEVGVPTSKNNFLTYLI